MDPLADALDSLRPHGAQFYRSDLGRPWGMAVPAGPPMFHVIEAGGCWLDVPGHLGPTALHAGDLVVLPRGDAHTLRDSPDEAALPLATLVRHHSDSPFSLRKPGDAPTCFVCGVLELDAGLPNPLLEALPAVVLVRAQGHQPPWLEHTLQFLACEAASGRPGAPVVMSHLAAVVFIHAIRAHLADLPPEAAGWLRGLRDPYVGPALAAVHRAPGAAWSVEALAAEAGLSRSAFALRFKALVGAPPLAYVTRWRMLRAARLLRTPHASMAEVAAAVGYESEAAFSKVFKRHLAQPPGAFRRALRAA